MRAQPIVTHGRARILALGMCLASSVFPAWASTKAPEGNALTLDWATTDAGGGTSAGGNFSVSGTIGQVDADPLQPSSGANFEVVGGFWVVSAAPAADPMFRDGFE